jgi:hypothetical protein
MQGAFMPRLFPLSLHHETKTWFKGLARATLPQKGSSSCIASLSLQLLNPNVEYLKILLRVSNPFKGRETLLYTWNFSVTSVRNPHYAVCKLYYIERDVPPCRVVDSKGFWRRYVTRRTTVFGGLRASSGTLYKCDEERQLSANWICVRFQVREERETPTLLGSLERANLNCWGSV